MSRFTITETPLAGLMVIQAKRMEDERGFLSRMFCATDLEAAGWTTEIRQINHTRTLKAGTIRGMHFQLPPDADMKLVNCIRGEVWDVAVDLRHGSPTYLRWHAEKLTGESGRALLIPEGFAHGFQTVAPDSELVYLHSADYSQESDRGINPLDPRLAITWPLEVGGLSHRDSSHPLLNTAYSGMHL